MKTYISTVGVDDTYSQRAVLHIALEVEHGALTCGHSHVVHLSCNDKQMSEFPVFHADVVLMNYLEDIFCNQ